MIRKFPKNIYTKPIKIAVLYSLFTLIMYLYGPYYFPEFNRFILICFVVISNIAMYIGFREGATKYYKDEAIKSINISKILTVFFIIALIISIPKFVIYSGFYVNTLSRILESIILFFSGKSQDIYEARQKLGNATGIWVYINYLVVLFGSIHWMYIPISIYYWKKLNSILKIGSLFIWAIYVLQYICTGTNVGLFEFFIMIFIINILKNITKIKKGTIKKQNNKYNFILFVLLGIILLSVFNFVMSSRIGDDTSTISLGDNRAYINQSSLFWKYVPISIQKVFLYVTRYLCAPYYALERSFDLPWNPTFGIGYSWFLLDNFPIDFWPNTYMMQLEEAIKYNHWASWHTAYMWFANDVSFWGVPILFYILFKVFGKSWALFLRYKNMCAFLLFMLFIKMVFFISANNQAFQASDHFMAFWELLLFLGWSRKYKWV